MSANSTSCDEPFKAIRGEEKERNIRQTIYKKWTEEGDEHRVWRRRAVFHGFGSSRLSDASRRRYAAPVRTWSIMKGPSHLGLSLFFCLSGRRRTSSPTL